MCTLASRLRLYRCSEAGEINKLFNQNSKFCYQENCIKKLTIEKKIYRGLTKTPSYLSLGSTQYLIVNNCIASRVIIVKIKLNYESLGICGNNYKNRKLQNIP